MFLIAYIQGGPVSIRDSTFSDNSAVGYGGLALFDHGAVAIGGEIVNSSFSGNIARNGLGGAMKTLPAMSMTCSFLCACLARVWVRA